MDTFSHPIPVSDLIPSDSAVAEALSLSAAKKLRDGLGSPANVKADLKFSGRKFLEKANIDRATNCIVLSITPNVFTSLDAIGRLIPFTSESYIEGLDRLLLRKLRAGSTDLETKPAQAPATLPAAITPPSKPVEATIDIQVKLDKVKEHVLSSIGDDKQKARGLKFEVAKILYSGEDSSTALASVKTGQISLVIASGGSKIVFSEDFIQANQVELLRALSQKDLFFLDGKLSSIITK